MNKKDQKKFKRIIAVLFLVVFVIGANIYESYASKSDKEVTSTSTSMSTIQKSTSSTIVNNEPTTSKQNDSFSDKSSDNIDSTFSISNYEGEPYVVINDNVPEFTVDEITAVSFENYGDLDNLGRCTTAFVCVGTDIMPTTERQSISSVKPTGWHSVKYDCVEQNYLYNRCHLIAYELTGENANELNLITGTRYMNVEGMLPFENGIAKYVRQTGNHVLYRVTPVFENNDLVAQGVHMEGYSVEDNGESISFNVFCFNVQPNIVINYKTGDSVLAQD